MGVPEGAMFDIDSLHPSTSTTAKAPASSDQVPAPRFAPLLEGRDERIKLKLDPRTLPLDESGLNGKVPYETMEEAIERHDAKIRKAEASKIQMEERKQKILEGAFASSDSDSNSDCSEES